MREQVFFVKSERTVNSTPPQAENAARGDRHLNGNALYCVGDRAFDEYRLRVQARPRGAPHDDSL